MNRVLTESLILEKVSKFSDQFSRPGKSFKRKDEVFKSGGKIGFFKKNCTDWFKKILTNQKSFKAGVLISLNALSHYFFSFFKGSDRRLCKTPLYRRTV